MRWRGWVGWRGAEWWLWRGYSSRAPCSFVMSFLLLWVEVSRRWRGAGARFGCQCRGRRASGLSLFSHYTSDLDVPWPLRPATCGLSVWGRPASREPHGGHRPDAVFWKIDTAQTNAPLRARGAAPDEILKSDDLRQGMVRTSALGSVLCPALRYEGGCRPGPFVSADVPVPGDRAGGGWGSILGRGYQLGQVARRAVVGWAPSFCMVLRRCVNGVMGAAAACDSRKRCKVSMRYGVLSGSLAVPA